MPHIQRIEFHKLQEKHYAAMWKMYEETRFQNKDNSFSEGYIYDKTDYESAFQHMRNIGSVFFIYEGIEKEEFIGFAVCFDSLDFKQARHFPINHLSKFLKHEISFIIDISRIGRFAFVNQLIIKKPKRNLAYGKILIKELFSHYEKKHTVTIAAVMHQWQFRLLKILKAFDVIFVDCYFYQDKDRIDHTTEESLWYRLIKILDVKKFYKKINPDTIPETFSTVIPIQLNLTTRNINKLIKGIGNSKIIWSSFFQYKYPVLDRVMPEKFHIGYYQPLVDSKQKDFDKVLLSIKRIIKYLQKKDSDNSIPSLNPSFSKKGFELFLTNYDAQPDEFDSFANPTQYNLNTVTVEEIIDNENFRIQKPANTATKNKWNDWLKLHKEMYAADRKIIKPKERWVHTVIPISFSHGGLMGVMFTYAFEEIPNHPKLASDLAHTISDAFAKNMFNILLKIQQREMVDKTLKFAISTIMSRNLSHNFGSHILARLSSPKSIERVLAEEEPINTFTKFSSYLRTRMDLLADISTSEPVNSISRKLYKDVINGFDKSTLVKRYISGTSLTNIDIEFNNQTSEDPDEDVTVQIPNGALGEHAFYIILENIIRNSIKHEKPENLDSFIITVEVNSYNEDGRSRGYKIRFYDNIPREKEDLQNLVVRINSKYIEDNIIKERNKIRTVGWGMIEMKVAASYLRKKFPARFVNTKASPTFIKAIKIHDHNLKNSYLGYEIYLKKPREILIIDTDSKINPHDKKQWINEGIKIISLKKAQNQQTHTHEITVLVDKVDRKYIEQQKTFPLRWIELKTSQEIKTIKTIFNQSIQDGILKIWQKWLIRYFKNKKINQKIILHIQLIKHDYHFEFDDHLEENEKENPPYLLVLDHHDFLMKGGKITLGNIYYEAFNSGSPTGILLNNLNLDSEYEKKRIEYELMEAACTKILLLDERIQQGLTEAITDQDEKEERRIDPFEQLNHMNIYVPLPSEVDMGKEDFGEKNKKEILSWIEAKTKEEMIDFVIIHLGIIERMIGSTNNDLLSFEEGLINIIGKRPEIVLISGRGKPHELPKELLFLNYSNVARHVLDERSKFHLCKLLFSARARTEYDEF